MRKIFLDCGAYNGCSVELFTKMYDDYEEYEVFSFEANTKLNDQIISTAKKYKFKKDRKSNFKLRPYYALDIFFFIFFTIFFHILFMFWFLSKFSLI